MSAHVSIRRAPGWPVLRAALAGGALASAVNVLLLVLARASGAVAEVEVDGERVSLGAAAVVGATMVAAVLAGCVALVLGRVTRRRERALLVLAVVFVAASLAGPMGIDGGIRWWLVLMHLVTGLVVVVAMLREMRLR